MVDSLRCAVVQASPSPPGRLHAATRVVARELAAGGADVTFLELRELLPALAAQVAGGSPGERLPDMIGIMERADCVVLSVPVYRASYPGLLKLFIDALPVTALRDTVVALLAMGGSNHHYLGISSQLAPVLGWFGALPLPNGLYLKPTDFESGQPRPGTGEALARLADFLVESTRRLRGIRCYPEPLGALI